MALSNLFGWTKKQTEEAQSACGAAAPEKPAAACGSACGAAGK